MALNLELSVKWARCLLRQGETGMGYQTASITLEDGRVIDDVLIVGGTIAEVAATTRFHFQLTRFPTLRSHIANGSFVDEGF
jgi:hypothetical protein